MGELNLKYSEGDGKHPHVNQCFLCKTWALVKNLSPIEVPDQTGWIEKKACRSCLDKILDPNEK